MQISISVAQHDDSLDCSDCPHYCARFRRGTGGSMLSTNVPSNSLQTRYPLYEQKTSKLKTLEPVMTKCTAHVQKKNVKYSCLYGIRKNLRRSGMCVRTFERMEKKMSDDVAVLPNFFSLVCALIS